MNQFRQAIIRGDTASAAGFYFVPEDLDASWRTALAQTQIAEDQFYRSVEACFGHDAAVQLGARMSSFIGEPLREYTADDFQQLGDPNIAVGRIGSGGTWRPLVRPPDGIWRINESGPSSEQLKELAVVEQAKADFFESLTRQVNEKRFRNLGELEDSCGAGDFAAAHRRVAANPVASSPPRIPAPPKIPAAILDNGTVRGAIDAYEQAFNSRDKAGIAGFFYSERDPNGKLAAANAERILAVLRLEDAVDVKFKDLGQSFVSDDTGLLTAADLTWWCDVEQQRGERAIGVFENNSQVSFRRIHGVWKLDITPPKPQTPTGLANKMARDSKILDQVTADVLAGKYKELSEVRDALVSAKLTGPVPAAPVPNAIRLVRMLFQDEGFELLSRLGHQAILFRPSTHHAWLEPSRTSRIYN